MLNKFFWPFFYGFIVSFIFLCGLLSIGQPNNMPHVADPNAWIWVAFIAFILDIMWFGQLFRVIIWTDWPKEEEEKKKV